MVQSLNIFACNGQAERFTEDFILVTITKYILYFFLHFLKQKVEHNGLASPQSPDCTYHSQYFWVYCCWSASNAVFLITPSHHSQSFLSHTIFRSLFHISSWRLKQTLLKLSNSLKGFFMFYISGSNGFPRQKLIQKAPWSKGSIF